jgi:hypothetical protein
VTLKRAAFGRRNKRGEQVDRDYHDVFQLLMGARREIIEEASRGDYTIRTNVEAAAEALEAGQDATIAAARERVDLGLERTPAAAQLAIRRGAASFLRDLRADGAKP